MSSGEIWAEARKDRFQFRQAFCHSSTFRFCEFLPGTVCFLLVQVAVRAHAYESLTPHPRDLCRNKTLHELENCVSLLTPHFMHLVHVKCLGLEHHR